MSLIVHRGFCFCFFRIITRVLVAVGSAMRGPAPRFVLRASWGGVFLHHPPNPPTKLSSRTATLNLNFFRLIFLIYGEVTLDSVWYIISSPSIIGLRLLAGVRKKAQGALGEPAWRQQCKPAQFYFKLKLRCIGKRWQWRRKITMKSRKKAI